MWVHDVLHTLTDAVTAVVGSLHRCRGSQLSYSLATTPVPGTHAVNDRTACPAKVSCPHYITPEPAVAM